MTRRSAGRSTERIRPSIRVAAFVSVAVFVSWVSPDTVAPRSSFWEEWPPLPRSIPRSDPEYQGPTALSEEGTCYWIDDVSASNHPMGESASIQGAVEWCERPDGADAEPGW